MLLASGYIEVRTGRFMKRSLRLSFTAAPLVVCALLWVMTAQFAFAQKATTQSSAASNAAAATAHTAYEWNSLTESERQTLAPLAAKWGTLSEGRRRKWIKIASTIPSMDQSERDKLNHRMEEWAKLSRNDREQARINFAQSKIAGKTDRQASWEAYQALSPEERQRLAETARHKPVGSTFVPKPVPVNKLIQVPVTRHTPPQHRPDFFSSAHVHPHTLLPVPGAKLGATAPQQP